MTIILSSITTLNVQARQISDSLTVHFRTGYSTFDRGFNDNGKRIDEFIDRIKSIQSASHLEISEVLFIASTSPEGSVKANVNLAKKRSANLTSILRGQLNFADSLVHITTNVGDWERLTRKVQDDMNVPDRDEALEVLLYKKDPERKEALESLNDGKTWDYLLRTHFPDLRSFRVFITIGLKEADLDDNVAVEDVADVVDESVPVIEDEPVKVDPMAVPVAEPEPVVVPDEPVIEQQPSVEPEAVVEPVPVAEPEQKDEWIRRLTVKTNLIGWGFLMTNAAVEIDIIDGLSFALPIYYSGWDYFTNTVKFRTLMIQPEIRYYFPKTKGLYVGAHFGMGYWNFALGEFGEKLGVEDWRYQDHKGESPALGGGLSLGYALQFNKNPRWGMEFAIGAGVYDAKYDQFYNEENGPYHKRGVRTTFIGIDNASISFTYKFDLKSDKKASDKRQKKEGKR